MSDQDPLLELEKQLTVASDALIIAWRIMRNNGMRESAVEVADTVLDVQEAKRIMKEFIEDAR